MTQTLSWQRHDNIQGHVLRLAGELDRETLLAFWQQRDALLVDIAAIDVSGLTRVDSTGLAMFVRLQGELSAVGHKVQITGISDNFNTLIELYGLTALINN
ncbi:lipid asymmetry maintenance protein MlaB [Moellerella wisconsensis]|uniref:STAS domain-containing protein n=1 Tax=Moellerella wisconsensis ATCC 35017 TaxID=1354267 RepID=A0A0N0IC45_9GAMM|nr:lipid asymmetry maintenance protein MlaB [Moellerella wisconsensis]KPD04472.1 hypothetical protein M992_0169 [Moellerella wisconsensis ATCC 35017]VFS52536.1 Probable phospholipid ABC transporter-binding protein mlaB [Moellerella wisconsensis]